MPAQEPGIQSQNASRPTEHLFAGKERDAESGNDYFPARYYASSMGRFQSPDWSATPEPVPYASLNAPQSLNLYAYASNSPLSVIDGSGHEGESQISCDFAFFEGSYASCMEAGAMEQMQAPGTTVEVYAQADPWPTTTAAGYEQGGERFRPSDPTTRSNAANNLVPPNPCQFQGNAMSPGQYVAAGAGAAALGPVPFLAISGAGFPRGSYLDAQPKASGNVFQRAAYGNYSFGVYMASAGVPYAVTLQTANAFAMFSTYTAKNGPMDSTYTNLPNANVQNITNGFNAARNGTTCHR